MGNIRQSGGNIRARKLTVAQLETKNKADLIFNRINDLSIDKIEEMTNLMRDGKSELEALTIVENN